MLAPLALASHGINLHCAGSAGAIIGLTSDGTYNVRLPADAPENIEKWTRVEHNHPPSGVKAVNGSFTGSYMQVLPDDKDSYHDIYGAGSFTMTGLEYAFDVENAGTHTLFLRWTAGDNYGAGDSLYAVMRGDATDTIVPGEPTLKPKLVGMNDNPGQFAGCCYDPKTHACPCYANVQTCEHFQVAGSSSRSWNPQCDAGTGQMESVPAPRWYLFAGQSEPTAMDFDTEPWDATCEAEGTGTADTGLDFASWNLPTGRYRLLFYPREDGTAIDAFYLAGPGVQPPGDLRLKTGASTTRCDGTPVSSLGGDKSGVEHEQGDATNWGHRSEPGVAPGTPCGNCLEPIGVGECPPLETLESMINCDNVSLYELCEADGECGTNVHLNNCEPPRNHSHHNAGDPRQRFGRDNDVYRRVPCVTDLPKYPDSGGMPAILVVLMTLCLSAFAAVSIWAIRKPEKAREWLKRLPAWLRGHTEANEYIRRHDSACASGPFQTAAAPSVNNNFSDAVPAMPVYTPPNANSA